ncbi:hypothetical protein TraAM80_06278 [Trypanosoma rangeli]|uniref:Uncharacterized protein n=1 Tax=Trypanosoma rangeli TaxID=5698 RepID=A0A422NAY3_TRYRA|nr:uncharacterized protein TraAM80_06278 [Trypanosoma rangeli]RNF02613.1 hypothetical protein TraAM80_06278 [Trypanosoma rangeli]|eukprot:RNF02613.1 hypothetical protein TraAM80_06278 [Trypanosoma rangeli]
MVFPETFGGDPIVIDEHCAISFVPQARGYFLAVACNTSQRRVKVRMDLTLSTRYCVFLPVVGTVHVGPMMIEATIAPYRVRNVGLVGPEKGALPMPLEQLLVCLNYDMHVFIEEETGVMLPVTKWKKGTKATSTDPMPCTLLPSTLAGAWPSWLSHLRVHEFTVCKRDVTLAAQGGDEGQANKVLVQIDEIAGGLAYLLSAVNKGRTPRRVLHKYSCEGKGAPSVCFVPMDGRECEDATTITGYVPGGGDVALGWVVRLDAETSPSCDLLLSLQAWTATACSPASTDVMHPQGGKDSTPIKSTPITRITSVSTRTFMNSQRRSGSGAAKGGVLLDSSPLVFFLGHATVESLSPPKSLPSSTNARASITTTENANQATDSVTFMSPQEIAKRKGLARQQISLLGNISGNGVQTPERREVGRLPAVHEREEKSEDNNGAGNESHLGTGHGDRTCVLEGHYVPHLRRGKRQVYSDIKPQMETELERSTASLGVAHTCRERVAGATEEETASTFTACVSHALRHLDCEEALKRISIETAEATAWKVCLLEWQQPLCIICANPIPSWALFVAEPSTGEKFHFMCYAKRRQSLQQQTQRYFNDATHCSADVLIGREHSTESLL